MKITKVDADAALAAARGCLAEINREYGDNIRFDTLERLSGRSIQVKLGVHNSRAYGARLSGGGRHTPAASWEAYRDWLRAFLTLYPEATVRTALATYRGLDGFEQDYTATGNRNVGSMAAPVSMRDCSL